MWATHFICLLSKLTSWLLENTFLFIWKMDDWKMLGQLQGRFTNAVNSTMKIIVNI